MMCQKHAEMHSYNSLCLPMYACRLFAPPPLRPILQAVRALMLPNPPADLVRLAVAVFDALTLTCPAPAAEVLLGRYRPPPPPPPPAAEDEAEPVAAGAVKGEVKEEAKVRLRRRQQGCPGVRRLCFAASYTLLATFSALTGQDGAQRGPRGRPWGHQPRQPGAARLVSGSSG